MVVLDTLTTQMHLEVFADTHPGRRRRSNQDSILAVTTPEPSEQMAGLLVVADGMGGHQAGEIASQMAVTTIYETLRHLVERHAPDGSPNGHWPSQLEMEAKLCLAVQQANHAIYRYGARHLRDAGDLGSTVTCALIYQQLALIANVGDTRAYHLRGGAIRQITSDHSYVAELVRNGEMSEEHLYRHPLRSVITRALGQQPEIVVDLFVCDLESGDGLILCSDGLWEMLHPAERIAAVWDQQSTPTGAVACLIESANEQGGRDNIGVAVCKITPN